MSQEYNIFGTNASLTYGPPDTMTYMRLIITDRTKIVYSRICTERLRSPYTEHAASGLHNPSPLEGEERFIQAQDQYILPPHVHTPMNDTRTRDVTRKRRHR